MGSYFSSFFEYIHVFRRQLWSASLSVVLVEKLRKVQRTGEACRASSDNENIRVEFFAVESQRLEF